MAVQIVYEPLHAVWTWIDGSQAELCNGCRLECCHIDGRKVVYEVKNKDELLWHLQQFQKCLNLEPADDAAFVASLHETAGSLTQYGKVLADSNATPEEIEVAAARAKTSVLRSLAGLQIRVELEVPDELFPAEPVRAQPHVYKYPLCG